MATKEKMGRPEAGRLGGQATARAHGPDFYERIGKKGGDSVSRDRAHMAEIGRKGGEAPHQKRGAHGTDRVNVEKKRAA